MKTINYAMTFAAALVLTTAVNVRAGGTSGPIMAVLSGATAMELPAKAAQLVSQADAKNLKQTTIDVVRAAVGLNPAAAASIVGSIAQTTPEMAATAAATAVSLVPDQAAVIARAAAAAAPNAAGKIVAAICRVLPSACQKVADAVAEVVPGADKEILTAITTAIPALKVPITQAIASSQGNAPSVSSVMTQISSDIPLATTSSPTLSAADSPSLADPTVGPPYVPRTTPSSNIDPGSGGVIPPGQRGNNYASP